MPRRIVLKITKDGKIHADYQDFIGDECFEEAARLKLQLSKYGVDYKEEQVETKPEAYTATREEEHAEGW